MPLTKAKSFHNYGHFMHAISRNFFAITWGENGQKNKHLAQVAQLWGLRCMPHQWQAIEVPKLKKMQDNHDFQCKRHSLDWSIIHTWKKRLPITSSNHAKKSTLLPS